MVALIFSEKLYLIGVKRDKKNLFGATRKLALNLNIWCWYSRPYLVLVPNYWTWIKNTSQKIDFSNQILKNWGHDNFPHRNDRATFILRRSGVANFPNIIKIVARFIKTTLKDSKEIERIRKYVLKCNLYLYFLI